MVKIYQKKEGKIENIMENKIKIQFTRNFRIDNPDLHEKIFIFHSKFFIISRKYSNSFLTKKDKSTVTPF